MNTTGKTSLSRRNFVLAGATAAAAPSVFLGAPAFAQTRKLKYTLPWLAEGPSAWLFVAKHQGFLAKQGIDIDISRGFGSVAAAQAIAAGQFDIGTVIAPPLVMSIAQGMPLYAIGAVEQDSVMGVCVLADSAIRKPADLVGKKIGAVPTSAEFPFFPAFCKKAGIDMSKNEIVQLDAKVLERALMEKQVDAITAIAGSSVPLLLSKGAKIRFITYRSVGLSTYGSLVTVTKKNYAADPGLYQAVMTGLMEALKFSLLDPEAAKEIYYKAVPEIAMSATGKDATNMGMGLQQVAILAGDGTKRPLGWSDTNVFRGMSDLVMEYIQKPNLTKPVAEEMFTNSAVGKVTLTSDEWTKVASNNKQYLSLLA